MRTEKQIIEFEANLIDCMNRFFEARYTLERTKDRERMFEAGFRMAWEVKANDT